MQLQYRHDGTGTTALARHEGPLRVLQRLYLEGPDICLHVLLRPARRDALLDGARAAVAAQATLSAQAGVTAPHERVVVLRALADRVEPAMHLLKQVWGAWRDAAWDLPATAPRLWRT